VVYWHQLGTNFTRSTSRRKRAGAGVKAGVQIDPIHLVEVLVEGLTEGRRLRLNEQDKS